MLNLMKPGERIPLINGLVDSLLPRPLTEAQLILDQFGVQTWQPNASDSTTVRAYFVERVKNEPDDNLEALHAYIVGEDANPSLVPTEAHPWGEKPVRVFLSHKWEDAQFVSGVKDVLEKYGISAFVAHNDIEPTRQWREVIKAGLRTCHMMVAVLHPDFHKSQWCDQEVGWALGRGIPVATVRRDVTDVDRGLDGFLEEVQDIGLDPSKGTGEWRAAQEIFRAAIRTVRPASLARSTLAEAFVTSFNFDNSRNLWSAISRQDQWDEPQLRRLEYAVETNRQVYDANLDGTSLADLVKDLLVRFDPAPVAPFNDEVPF